MMRIVTAESSPDPSVPSMPRLVLALATPYHAWLTIIVIAMLAETAAGLAAPWPLKIVIDHVVDGEPIPPWLVRMLGPAVAGSGAAVAAAATVGVVLLAAIGGLASYLDNYYTESVGQWVANDLRVRVFDHLEHLSFNYYDTHQTGTLLSTMTDDVRTIQDFVSSSVLGMLIDVTTIAGMLGLMFWLNWGFTLIVLAVTPFLLMFVARFKRAVKRATREVRQRESDIVSVVQTDLEAVRTIQAVGSEDVEESRLAAASRATVTAALRSRRIKSLLSPIIGVVVSICTAIVMWRGSVLILAGAMTLGSLTVFLSYLSKFFKPVQDLAKMSNTIAQASVAFERIRSILDITLSIPERPGARDPVPFQGAIAFQHVAFGYDADTPILRDVDCPIRPGSFVGVVGATGSGKSTIASLIPRFYDVSDGRILIDGIDIREFTVRGLRRQIGFVLQDTVLFRGTIHENIAYGTPHASEAHIIAAAKLANAHEFIARMPAGYDTLVGERGVTLSGGQRQRIGIARALIRNQPILILDEPTAALDPESESLVMEGLFRLMRRRTVIMITHRLDTLRDADVILVLRDGVIVERGTHPELLAAGAFYAALYRARTSDSADTAWSPVAVAAGAVA
jgi:ABC-type multidrug transport system fused ATPase/permease subunit